MVATARRGNLPIYLYGLGTVTPLKTVDVKTRVDGAITQINYTEGQHVKTGDFLLQIDPRPYQAALDQAKGQLAQSKAQLELDQINLGRAQDLRKREVNAIQDLDTAKTTVDTDTAKIQSAQAAVAAAFSHATTAAKRTMHVTNVASMVRPRGKKAERAERDQAKPDRGKPGRGKLTQTLVRRRRPAPRPRRGRLEALGWFLVAGVILAWLREKENDRCNGN